MEALLDDHAYDKHVVEKNEFPDVEQPPDVTLAESKAQFQETVQNAIDDADFSGYDTDGTRWFYDQDSNTIIFDGSTAASPHAGTAYIPRPNPNAAVPPTHFPLPDGTMIPYPTP